MLRPPPTSVCSDGSAERLSCCLLGPLRPPGISVCGSLRPRPHVSAQCSPDTAGETHETIRQYADRQLSYSSITLVINTAYTEGRKPLNTRGKSQGDAQNCCKENQLNQLSSSQTGVRGQCWYCSDKRTFHHQTQSSS